MRIAVARETDWQFLVFDNVYALFGSGEDFGMAVVPVDDLPLDPGDDTEFGALIAYGPAESIRRAFLLGCRDYLRVPWSPTELILRGESALYRDVLELSAGRVRFDEHLAVFGERSVELGHWEYVVLKMFARSRDGVVRRDSLRAVFDYPPDSSRIIDVYVSRVRKKLAHLLDDDGAQLLRAVRGVGYRLLRGSVRQSNIHA
jgi:DNA-binding response OmpR family regulator